MNRQSTGRAVCALGQSAPSLYNMEATKGSLRFTPGDAAAASDRRWQLTSGGNDQAMVYQTKAQDALDEALKLRLQAYVYAPYSSGAAATDQDKFEAVQQKLTHMDYQLIMKEYVTACAAIDSFFENGKPVTRAFDDVARFLVVSLGLSLAFVGVSVAFAYWGGETSPLVDAITATNFFGWPTKQVYTCMSNASDTVVTSSVDLDGLLVAKNLYCGLMLGLVFGFLDNFGLFYGMDKLDPILYRFGTNVICGAMMLNKKHIYDGKVPDDSPSEERGRLGAIGKVASKQMLLDTHNAADKLMAGLGNTFRYASAQLLPTPRCQESNRRNPPQPLRSQRHPRCHSRHRRARHRQVGTRC